MNKRPLCEGPDMVLHEWIKKESTQKWIDSY